MRDDMIRACSIWLSSGSRLSLRLFLWSLWARSTLRAHSTGVKLRFRPLLFASFLFLFPWAVSADTLVSDKVATTSTWTKEGSPYILNRSWLYVPKGVALSIDPGVVVKGVGDYRIDVEGELDIRGSAAEPVIFTSLFDSESGGDTGAYLNNFDATNTPMLRANIVDSKLRVSYDNGQPISYIIWTSDGNGGRGGSAFVGASHFDFGDPPIPVDSNVEAVVSDAQIDGTCGTPIYSGVPEVDFKCALDFAKNHDIQTHIY